MALTGATHEWYSVGIQMTGLPARAEFVPVTVPLDFGAMLGVREAVDEHSLRLYRVGADGSESEEPVQFAPAEQERHPEVMRQAGTPETVSWVGEWLAGQSSVHLLGAHPHSQHHLRLPARAVCPTARARAIA